MKKNKKVKQVKRKRKKYNPSKKKILITGVLQGHQNGFGFVIPEQEDAEDVFIKNKNMNGAMHGDKVICRVDSISKGNKKEGTIEQILERAYVEIVGIYEPSKDFAFVVPQEKRIFQDIFIPNKNFNAEAKKGDAVVVKIEKYPSGKRKPEGKILEVLGDSSDPAVELDIAIRKYGLSKDFPENVNKAAKKLPLSIPETDISERLDLREQNIFTIDGITAKDFDDAVSIELLENNNLKLGVHIADVSYYVKEGSVIDTEAYNRATSVYFPGTVVPMLPFKLSNELCSLKPKEDRLTLSCIMEIDSSGTVVNYTIAESIINSIERLTYTDIASFLKGEDQELCNKYSHIKKDLHLMETLCKTLQGKRAQEGSIDFDLPEAEIILDIQGKPENIIKVERNIAHRIIEEFMLLANKTVAKHLSEKPLPSIYRIHEKPAAEKMIEFNEFIYNLGYSIKTADDIKSTCLREVLSAVKDKTEERLINFILLRSMKQAKYSTKNIGHFGLSFEFYTHFTSPIRRYPDLIVHRLLKKTSSKKRFSEDVIAALEEPLAQASSHCSVMERKAEEAERDIVNLKKIQFMKDKVGETFKGYISGVSSFGIFVELEECFVEGLVHVTSMDDDYYSYMEKQFCLIGDNNKKTFRLGDKLTVKIINVNLEKREIELNLV